MSSIMKINVCWVESLEAVSKLFVEGHMTLLLIAQPQSNPQSPQAILQPYRPSGGSTVLRANVINQGEPGFQPNYILETTKKTRNSGTENERSCFSSFSHPLCKKGHNSISQFPFSNLCNPSSILHYILIKLFIYL